MIGRLKGVLVHKQPPWLVVDVGGVGYELEAPMSTFYDLPEPGREVSLFTHYAPREGRRGQQDQRTAEHVLHLPARLDINDAHAGALGAGVDAEDAGHVSPGRRHQA